MSPPIAWPSMVTGERAAIAVFDEPPALVAWLEEAAQAIAGRAEPCRIEHRLSEGDQGCWIVAEGINAGALCVRITTTAENPERMAVIWTWLAVDARWRAYGFGGAAVPLVESAARSVGATLALVPLPPDNGVALYFWLRLGYTPLRSVDLRARDWPSGVARDALWMQRSLISTEPPEDGAAADANDLAR